MSREQFYLQTAECLKLFLQNHSSIKTLCFGQNIIHPKATFALLVKVLKNRSLLSSILASLNIDLNFLSYLFLFDLLLGEGLPAFKKISSKAIQLALNTILSRKEEAISLFHDLHFNTSSDIPSSTQNFHCSRIAPRWLRINTLKTNKKNIPKELERLGYSSVPFKTLEMENQTDKLCSRMIYSYDNFVINLLCFPFASPIINSDIVRRGELIIQDKGSCLPVLSLSPKVGSIVIDGCAAPGNKTQQIASIMSNTGKIFAIEYNSNRSKTLSRRLKELNVTNSIVKNISFLDVMPDEKDYCEAEYILLDPSCSGSGRVSLDRELGNKKLSLEPLVDFQKRALLHCFQFPKVTRIVYSTCSVNFEENEGVIGSVLNEASQKGFELITVLPKWQVRGAGKEDWCSKCIRTDSIHTTGFFVACFVRNPNPKLEKKRKKFVTNQYMKRIKS